MPVKVSVVVPVYNPGKYIDPCVSSLLGQTLPAEDVELLFVDDGSTDDSPARLDELAVEHPQVRVVHLANSGWPGKPRNIGVAEARGEYVQFLDQDDHMAPDALRRLYELGHRNSSDIVIGKVASNFRGVPHGVFRITREKCTLRDAPLVDSLTPHKMFRTAFLREHGIAYAEGKRRLEDQLYMMTAYFAAKNVSVLGDYICYHYSKRDDGKNAGSAKIVPSGYYDNLRDVLDVVVANTEPGAFRDSLLRRFYRVEMLGRLSEPSVLGYEPAFLDEMVGAVHALAADHIGDGVHDGLGALSRLRSTLLRRKDPAKLVEAARRAASVKGHARLEGFAWENGRIAIDVTARLRHADGTPFTLLRDEGRYYLHPDLLKGLLEDGERIEVTDEVKSFRAEVHLRDRETAVEWTCPASFETRIEEVPGEEVPAEAAQATEGAEGEAAAEVDVPAADGTPGDADTASGAAPGGDTPSAEAARPGETARPDADPAGGTPCEVVLRGTAWLDPKQVKGRPALTRGMWDVWVPVRGLGLNRKARLGADRDAGVDAHCLPALLGSPAVPTVPYFTDPHGNLTLDVARRGKRLGGALAGHPALRMPGARGLEIELPVVALPGTAPSAAVLLVRGQGEDAPCCELPALVEPFGGRVHLRAGDRLDPAGRAALGAGTWALSARLDGPDGPELPIGRVHVDASGRVRLCDELGTVDSAVARTALAQRRRADRRALVHRFAHPLTRRLSAAARARLRLLAVRLGL